VIYLFQRFVYQIPRGTRDFTIIEMQNRRYVEEKIRSTFESYGYKEVQTPTFENLELFTAKSGEGIIDEIYSFKDKGGRDLALRPELTAPVIRFYVEKLQMEPKPLKLYYFGNCYRYDRPQKGRYREFTQAGCEIIGTDTPESTAELISMAYNILKNLGLKKIRLKVGNLIILKEIFKKIKLTEEKQKYIIPLIDKNLYEELMNAMSEFRINQKDISEFIDILENSDIEKLRNYLKDNKNVLDEIEKFEKIKNLLENSYKISDLSVKMSIVRGLDYYTGTVFEIEAPCLGAESQLCGGGVYELIELFDGRPSGQAGFALGFDRTIIAMGEEKIVFPKKTIDLYIIPIDEKTILKAVEIAENLRKNGLNVDMDLLRRNIGKALKYASSINAKKVIIIGPDEIEKNVVSIKDMKTGKQETVKIDDLINFLK